MDILLTHGYFLQEDEAERRIMKPYPPLGILYLSAYLKSKKFSVDIFDSTFHTKDDFRKYIEQHSPAVVGIYVNLMTKLNALEMIAFCKRKGCKIILGGPEVPFHAEEFLAHGADIIVIGEGEQTLEEVLLYLNTSSPKNLADILGIAYRDANGMIVRTGERPLIADLDSLPDPDRAAINIQQYVDTWRTHHGRGSVSLICSRGCPFTCTWCSRSVYGDTHRRRSPKRVVDEIEYLLSTYRPDQLWFADDVFTINHRWFDEFYAEMKRRSIRIPYECISRADRLNEEILSKMSELGAFRVWYGSESGSQRILDAMQRRVKVDQITSVTKIAQRYGIQAGLFVMLGYPGEEIADIDSTVHHLVESQPDTYLTTVAYPIKGTQFYAEVKDRIISKSRWDASSDRMANFTGRHSDNFYWFATRYLTNEVRFNKLMSQKEKNAFSLLSSYAKARFARIGMRLTEKTRT